MCIVIHVISKEVWLEQKSPEFTTFIFLLTVKIYRSKPGWILVVSILYSLVIFLVGIRISKVVKKENSNQRIRDCQRQYILLYLLHILRLLPNQHEDL